MTRAEFSNGETYSSVYCNGIVATAFLALTAATPKVPEPSYVPIFFYRTLNTSTNIRFWNWAVSNGLPDVRPSRAAFIARLDAIRRDYIESGGTLLNDDELDAALDERRDRRGAVHG
jgi:hypothetical protein